MKAHLRLHFQFEQQPVTAEMETERLTLGRDHSADLAIPDITISRQHAQIIRTEHGFCIQDLGSKNGTKVNGSPVQTAYLSNGDQITLGQFPVYVEITTDRAGAVVPGETSTSSGSRVVMEDSQMHAEGTVVRSLADIKKFLAGEKRPEKGAPPSAIEEENRILMVLSQVARALISVEPLDDTLQKVMQLVLKHILAERGILMLIDEKNGELVPSVVRMADGDARPGEEVRMSRTIASKVIEEQVAVLSSDVQTDSRFTGGESIRIMGIHSAMCVPLWNQDKVIGLIQVDTQKTSTIYTERDLDLLTALANYAAVAIERARLNERIEHERTLKSRLERYHSPQVAQRILASQGEGHMEAVEKNVSVLFADLVGFTPLAEKLPPAEVARLLNRVFEKFTDIIFRHEGTLDKYLGDAVMAVFGAPMDSQRHAVQAVRAAFEMLDAIKGLNETSGGSPLLQFHFGINSGPVVAGDIGSPRRKEYTVLGNTVNTAARIQAGSPPDAIWVGPQTYEAVKEVVTARKVGEEKFKGLAKPIPIYHLESIRPLQDEETHETQC